MEGSIYILDKDALGVRLRNSGRQNLVPNNEASDNLAVQPTAFASKGLSSTESYYSNIKRKALDIQHGSEKFHHYCFDHEVAITDHKPLVPIVKKDMMLLTLKDDITTDSF